MGVEDWRQCTHAQCVVRYGYGQPHWQASTAQVHSPTDLKSEEEGGKALNDQDQLKRRKYERAVLVPDYPCTVAPLCITVKFRARFYQRRRTNTSKQLQYEH